MESMRSAQLGRLGDRNPEPALRRLYQGVVLALVVALGVSQSGIVELAVPVGERLLPGGIRTR